MIYVYHVQHKVEALNRSNSNIIKALLFNESLTLALFFCLCREYCDYYFDVMTNN